MDLRQLKIFTAVYDSGSIVRAAELERSAPSVLAHHLANLEARVGVPLLERNSRGVVPTEAGRRLYAHAVSILRSVELAEQDMRNTRAEVTGTVVIGMAYSAARGVALPLMTAILAGHPKLKIDIAESLSGATVERLIEARVDIAVAYNPSQDSRLTLTPLLEEDLVCIGTRAAVGDTDKPLPFDEFIGMTFLLPRKGPTGRPIIDSIEHQKILEEKARFYSENLHIAQLFVENGQCCMLGARSYIERDFLGRNLVCRDIVDPPLKRTLFLCDRKDTPPSRAIALVRRLLIDLIREEIESKRWPSRSLLGAEHRR